MANFAVVGSGAWGTALAAHVARLGHDVVMWAFEPEVAREIATQHVNSTFLPGIVLPETIRASHDRRWSCGTRRS
jgi:glycerol-3-phosphate dehydrogenase (NAD(P)+)